MHASVRGDAVLFRDREGRPIGWYDALVVLDARGERIPARLDVDGDRVRIAVDDANARYPLVVDPLVQVVLLTTFSLARPAADIAVSSDGGVVASGSPSDSTAAGPASGTVRVFVRSGSSWSEETTLSPSTATASEMFGSRVEISAAGDRIAAMNSGSRITTFVRGAGGWAETGSIADAMQTFALDAAGMRIATARMAAVRVWAWDGTAWQAESLAGSPSPTWPHPYGVAFSEGGSRLLVGERDGARFYTRSGTTWSSEWTRSPRSAGFRPRGPRRPRAVSPGGATTWPSG